MDDHVFNARYVHKLKQDATSGLVSRFKARLIVQGYRMQNRNSYKPVLGLHFGGCPLNLDIFSENCLKHLLSIPLTLAPPQKK
jgi:hypothetical protein